MASYHTFRPDFNTGSGGFAGDSDRAVSRAVRKKTGVPSEKRRPARPLPFGKKILRMRHCSVIMLRKFGKAPGIRRYNDRYFRSVERGGAEGRVEACFVAKDFFQKKVAR